MAHGGRYEHEDERDAAEAREAQRVADELSIPNEDAELERYREMVSPKHYGPTVSEAIGRVTFVPTDYVPFLGRSNALARQVDGGHYKKLAIQPIEYAVRNKLGPCETHALKYITRHRDKNGAADVRKAIHVLELLLELEYPGE